MWSWSLFYVAALVGISAVPIVISVQIIHIPRILSRNRNDHNDENQDIEEENEVEDININSITDNHPEFYPHSTIIKTPAKMVPAEYLAKKAHGEPGEKWKVLGYSETTGYPIIDLSTLGIDTTPKPYMPTVSKKNPNQNIEQKKPVSYSEMKGLKKPNSNTKNDPNFQKTSVVNSNYYKLKKTSKSGKEQNRKAERVAEKLHMQLHRTHRHETVRSILYPKTNPPKYRISTETKKIKSFLRFGKKIESKGKYDIRYLDVEKLMDIIVPDAVVLVYKYIRDLPSVPLIYECKTGILFPFVKIMGGFQQLDKYLGKTFTTIDDTRRRYWLQGLLRILLRWILGITPRKATVEGAARNLEHDLTMFAQDLPGWTDKDCEGQMDERDWNTFNFHYNYMIENLQLEDKREDSKKSSIRSEIKNKGAKRVQK